MDLPKHVDSAISRHGNIVSSAQSVGMTEKLQAALSDRLNILKHIKHLLKVKKD